MTNPGDEAGDCPRCGETLVLIGHGNVTVGNRCPGCDLIRVLDYHDVEGGEPWHGGQPDASLAFIDGYDTAIRHFECVCGNVIVDSETDERKGMPGFVYPDWEDSLNCHECGREWRLEDDGYHWEHRQH